MGFLVPKALLLEVLQAQVNAPLGWTLKLYGNNKTPAPGDSTAGYTEIAGGGYVAKPIVSASWTINSSGDFPQAIYNTTQLWTFTGAINSPGTIYGYFMTRNSDSKLMLAERFSTALVPFSPELGSEIRVLPRYSVRSQF